MKSIKNLCTVVASLLTIGLSSGCDDSKRPVHNLADYTADWCGNYDGFVDEREEENTEFFVKEAKEKGLKGFYISFMIQTDGTVEPRGQLYLRDDLPQVDPISLMEHPAYNSDELTFMSFEGIGPKTLGKAISPIGRWGLKRIGLDGEIKETYLLTENGLEEQ